MENYKFYSLLLSYDKANRKELFTNVKSNLRNALVLVYNTFFYYLSLAKYKKKLSHNIWVFNNSINQFNSSKFLKSLRKIVFISLRSQKNKHIDLNIFYGLFNLTVGDARLIYKLCQRNKKWGNLIDYLTIAALYRTYLNLIGKHNPKSIVLLNDHSFKSKIVLYAGKHTGTTTIYIQHASVTPKFPKLEFDYALLEGETSKNTYLNICPNIQTNIELIGMGKLDQYITQIPDDIPTEINKIGIATNTLDSFDAVIELNEEIQKRGIKTIIRPHPRDQNIPRYYDTFDHVSDSKTEDFASFISQIDFQIAGNSSIHLEAVALRKYSYFYAFKRNKKEDNYGYVRHGLIKEFNLEVLDNKDLYYPERKKIAEYIHGYNYGKTTLAIPLYLKRVGEISGL